MASPVVGQKRLRLLAAVRRFFTSTRPVIFHNTLSTLLLLRRA
jgi:hypothetical protein